MFANNELRYKSADDHTIATTSEASYARQIKTQRESAARWQVGVYLRYIMNRKK